VLTRSAGGIDAEFVSLASASGATHPPTAQWVAEACAALAESRDAQLLLLDGSQAWKDPANGHLHARSCERALHTPAKTGEPGHVKPRPYTAFIAFSVAVFDALHALGWPRLESATAPHRRSVEVFPHAAWKRLGLMPLPAKAKCSAQRLEEAHEALRARARIHDNGTPSHGELQALVAGIAGLAMLEGDAMHYDLAGEKPQRVEGIWREGFVLVPRSISDSSGRAERHVAARLSRARFASVTEVVPEIDSAADRPAGIPLDDILPVTACPMGEVDSIAPVVVGDVAANQGGGIGGDTVSDVRR
jgi:hypothetical protein